MRIVSSGSITLVGRILHLLSSTIFSLILPLIFDTADLGTFFLAQLLVAIGAVIAQCGLTYSVPAILADALARVDAIRARALCLRALIICGAGSVAVSSIVGLLFQLQFIQQTQLGQQLNEVLGPIVCLIPVAAVTAVLTEIHRARQQFVAASLLPLSQTVGLFIGMFGASHLSLPLTITTLLYSGLGAMLGAALASASGVLVQMRRWTKSSGSPVSTKELLAECWPNLVTSVSLFLVSTADIWIAGTLGGAAQAAYYGLGLRIAAILLIPLTVVNATISPQIISNWTTGRRRSLQWLLTLTATGAALASALGYFILCTVGPFVLRAIWGEALMPAFTIAAILGLGQLVQSAGGSAGYILLFLGKQKLMMSVSLITGFLTIVAAVAAMMLFGLYGLAFAYMVANVAQTGAMILFVKKDIGLDPAAKMLSPSRLRALLRHSDFGRRGPGTHSSDA